MQCKQRNLLPNPIMTSSDNQSEDTLENAAIRGDVAFLRNFLNTHNQSEIQLHDHTMIFHLATSENRELFIKEATQILPIQTTRKLILQLDKNNSNPLHKAASMGNLMIVKSFLDVFRSSQLDRNEKPWLQKNSLGQTPCHVAILNGHEDCGLKILGMDMEDLCKVVDNEGISLVYGGVSKGLNRFAMEILRLANDEFSCSGSHGYTPLHYVTNCEDGEDICRLLLEKKQMLVAQMCNGESSAFHIWAEKGKLWPFKLLLDKIDIIPNFRNIFLDLISATNTTNDSNPLHILATSTCTDKQNIVEIAQILIKTYKQIVQSSFLRDDNAPWLAYDTKGCTPLSLAINNKHEDLALYILSMDHNVLRKCRENALILAIKKGCYHVVELILEIIDKHGWTRLLIDDNNFNAMHYAPLCNEGLFKRLLKRHPELLIRASNDRITVLHSWVEQGKLWAINHVLRNEEIDHQFKREFIKLISTCDSNARNTPLHIAAKTTNESIQQLVKLLIKAYKDETPNWVFRQSNSLPWLQTNGDGDGPLHLALKNKNEKLGLYFLSIHDDNIMGLLDCYRPCHKTVFDAIKNNCFIVAKEILNRLSQNGEWTIYVTDQADGRTILHLAPMCTEEELGRWVVRKASVLMNQADNHGTTPLEVASEVGAAWFIKEFLEIDTEKTFESAPSAWKKACTKGHISVISVFIKYYPGKFKDHCLKHKDSPLHHIKLRNITEYEQFLKLPGMSDLINFQDSGGATPLHQAIRRKDILLSETLLMMDKIRCDIKDQENKTARDLLLEACDSTQQQQQPNEWEAMCKSVGLDPRIKTSYFQPKTNLLEVRNTLSVVAALLATITFTAGFTLPGGLNSDNGEAILAKNPAFLLFLISDTIAMCCSMLVLICLIWSMVYESNKSLLVIDRSMTLLFVALYCTLLAFMTGVYIVISPNSLWAAIFILVICSLIGISANKTLLYKILDNFVTSTNKDHDQDQLRLLEMGKFCSCRGFNNCFKCN